LGWFYSIDDKTPYWTGNHAGLSIGTVEWIYAHEVAAIAMDNRTFEATPFEQPYDITYPLHSRLIRDLGLTIGELWWLDDLAAACARFERWEFPTLRIAHCGHRCFRGAGRTSCILLRRIPFQI